MSSTGLKSDIGSFDAGSISLIKPTRRRSKAVIEVEDDDEEAQPAENQSPPNVDILLSRSVVDGADTEMANTNEASCREPKETMIFTDSLPQTSNLSASAQEFQPRILGKTQTGGGMQQFPPPDLLARSCHQDFLGRSCHQISNCLPYPYPAPLPGLCPAVGQQPDSLLYHSLQVLI